MSRSLRLNQRSLDRVKLALKRNGFPSQRALAEEVGLALTTVNNFFTGKPVDYSTFEELSRQLALDWKEIADLDFEATLQKNQTTLENFEILPKYPENLPPYPSGAVPLDSPFYLERVPLEAKIKQELRKPGALIRIKAPREMGKTSLLLRILEFAQTQNYQIVSLNLDQVDRSILNDLDRFLRWFCANTARQLHLEPRLDEYWARDLGSKISCTCYLEEYLLKSVQTPLVLALDEAHQIFEYSAVAKDFVPLLRSWYEKGKNFPVWQKLRSIVVHSTEIYVPLQINQSPFNVGFPVQLTPFGLEEVRQLARRYGLDWEGGEEAEKIMGLVGGHPALVQIALYHLALGEITLEQLPKTAPTDDGIYSAHLRRHRVALEEQPELARAIDLVMSATEPISLDSLPTYKLYSMGLIKPSAGKAIPSNELYRRYFRTGFPFVRTSPNISRTSTRQSGEVRAIDPPNHPEF